MLLSLKLFKLRLKLCNLRVYIRLFGNKAAKVNAVQLRKLRDGAFGVFGKLLGVADQLANTANGVHSLHLPILLIRGQHFA